jgi:hypothetical protein
MTALHDSSNIIIEIIFFSYFIPLSVVVVIAFAVCWSPFHLQRLLFSYIEPSALNQDLSFCINYGSGVLFFISTCINPFLYNIMSNKFREAFKVNIFYEQLFWGWEKLWFKTLIFHEFKNFHPLSKNLFF